MASRWKWWGTLFIALALGLSLTAQASLPAPTSVRHPGLLAQVLFPEGEPPELAGEPEGDPAGAAGAGFAAAAGALDRDTRTVFSSSTRAQIDLSLEASRQVAALKVYGAAPFVLTLRAWDGTAWQEVAGLRALDLTRLAEGWAAFEAASPVSAERLRLDLVPASSASTGLAEVEVWGPGRRVIARTGAALLAAARTLDPPPQARLFAAAPAEVQVTTPPPPGFNSGAEGDGSTPGDGSAPPHRFTFSLDRPAGHLRRAWIAYDTLGLSHWSAALRSLNGQAPLGGNVLVPPAALSSQVEEVSPEWLRQGENTLDFFLPEGSASSYTVRNVALLGELDDGGDFVSHLGTNQPDGANPPEAAQDGLAATGWTPYPTGSTVRANEPTLELHFDRSTQIDGLLLDLSGTLKGLLGVAYLEEGVWVAQRQWIEGRTLRTGRNVIPAPSLGPALAARLTFSGGNGSSAQLVEAIPIGSGVGPTRHPPSLRVTFPDAGQYYGREAHLRGFLAPLDNGSGPALIRVGGRDIARADGAFEIRLSKDDVGLADEGDAGAWSVEVEAVYPDGETARRTIELTQRIAPPESSAGKLLGRYSYTVAPGQAKKVVYDASEISFAADAVAGSTTLSIQALREIDLPGLDQGMTNVTRGPRRGYRYEPHGMKFRSAVQVTLPYNRSLIPPGHTADDIRTYYFDEQAGSWKALERVKIDTQAMTVVSLTDHFTDMINATVTVPDHPQPLAYNPTSIKDIKAADPGAGINLIEPPQANSMGDARLTYPLEVPPGRGGMQPQLALQYNSSGGNGWTGLGWDLPMQKITIDTRWGVPRYDPALETETYTLSGEQLTPVAHRGELRPRAAEKEFHARVEGQFRRILRHGDHPSRYWWEVVDKNGTRYFYGGGPEVDAGGAGGGGGSGGGGSSAGGPAADSVLADPAAAGIGNIYEWALREVRDTNGNAIRYHCEVVERAAPELTRQIYLRRISYTGRAAAGGAGASADGPYEVVFHREAGRPDLMVDGRGGFRTETADRLAQIDVRMTLEAAAAAGLASPLIRRYRLEYVTGQFSKSLLARVIQYGDDGSTEFNRHEFEYFDEVGTAAAGVLDGFRSGPGISDAETVRGEGLLTFKDSSSLAADVGKSRQRHLYVGISPGTCDKKVSAGFKVGGETSTQRTKLSLIDLNGDGLPDQVFRSGDDLVFRPNTGGPAGDPDFGPEIPLASLSELGREQAATRTFGVEGFAIGINGLADLSLTRTRGEAYLSDVNGDRLPDLVRGNGAVLFNRLEDGVPTFAPASPTPLGAGAPSDASSMVQDPDEARAEMERTYYLVDPLRRWVAPYHGVVSISGQVRLLEAPPDDYETADGVRASIQHNGGEIWAETIPDPTDPSPRTVTGLGGVSVHAGDRIYFRVHSRDDGSFDSVEFDPTVTYTHVEEAPAAAGSPGALVAADPTLTDENGVPAFIYSAGAEYAYGGRPLEWTAPFSGTATLRGDFGKAAVTTDDVTLVVERSGAAVFEHTLRWHETGSVPIAVPIATTELDELRVWIHADSRIDLTGVRFAPTFTYDTVEGEPAPADDDGSLLLVFSPPVLAQIYPVNAFDTPYSPWVAPETGRIRVTQAIHADPLSNLTTDITLAIKRPGALLAKQKVEIRGGSFPVGGATRLEAELDVMAGDVLYFTADATSSALPGGTIGPPFYLYLPAQPTDVPRPLPYDVHLGLPDEEPFGGGFRRWYFGQYNGRDGALPVVEGRLRLPGDDSDTAVNDFLGMIPFHEQDHFQIEDDECWIRAGRMSASRRMVNYLDFPDGSAFGGARGVVRYGGGRTRAGSISVNGFGAGASFGENWSDVDFLDFNGDAYPDVVGGGSVQATLPNGALGGGRIGVGTFGRVRETDSRTFNVNLGATISVNRANARGGTQQNKTEQASYNVSPGVTGGLGEVDAKWDLVDINGDGLPDHVRPAGGGLRVRLNLGYRFGAEEDWGGSGKLRFEKTASVGASLGAGVAGRLGKTKANYSFGGGLSSTRSSAGAERDLVDVNGDGLLDIVRKDLSALVDSDSTDLGVRFNTGSAFTSEYSWEGTLPRPVRENTTFSRNLGLHFSIKIPISITPKICLILNPGFNRGDSLGGFEVMLNDLDGDGYADHVYSDTEGNVAVKLNNHGRTNLLRRVRRPLGAVLDLDYARSGNTTDQPGNRWVLSRAEVFDGLPGDGADRQLTTYQYGEGFYDRAERDFYGFRTVAEEHRDLAGGETLYRSIVRMYLNRSYYEKGLLESERTLDAAGRPFLETSNTYDVIPVDDGAAVPTLEEFTATRFPALVRTDRRFFEGQPALGKSTTMTYEYDSLGNVIRMTDSGDTGASDDVEALITYFRDDTAYIVGKPDSIRVLGDGRLMRERHATIEAATGNLRQVRQHLETGPPAVTDLDYSPEGNLVQVTGPQNLHGQRYAISFEYDPVVLTHIQAIQDSFGYRSTATHNFKYGTVDTNRDINNQSTRYTYDAFGRVSTITGPYELGSGSTTIEFSYQPHASVPVARTRHIDTFRDPSNPIETLLFTDGLKRVVQTKKDATVHVGPQAASPPEVMIVSGRLTFDFIGRTTEQFYPVTEEKQSDPFFGNAAFNPAYDTVQPTRMAYDVLDRTTRTTIPDNTSTTMEYGFGSDRFGAPQFETIVTDANGVAKRTYRDVRELITAVKEFNRRPDGTPETLWTSYEYDPLKQIVKVLDDRQNLTRVEYDNFGRRTVIDNPDAGRIETRYDLAGNVTARITANLMAEGKQIAYDYEFNRLRAITYPNFPGNNVTYTYGGPGVSFNRANRIVTVADQSGLEERFYGPLGEIVKEIKTIASDTQGSSSNAPEVYTTEYEYDTWNRLQRLVYPDGEVLTYQYDAGGLLRQAFGAKSGYSYDYLRRLEYDKFEQRAFVLYGNNVQSSYSYDAQDRRLVNLQSGNGVGTTFQNLLYTYDNVGNILSLQNSVPVPAPSQFGGPSLQSFRYDDLYRLTSATGTYSFAPDKTRRYSMGMSYDTIHNIQLKTQLDEIVQPSGTPIRQHKTSYNFGYQYSPSGAGSVRPHAPIHIGDRTFSYDANGNQTGWQHDRNGTRRTIVWDEENRIQTIYENGQPLTYKYNDAGERVIKRGPQGETVYVNPYFTIRNREVGTKHIFAGTSRVVSKLMKQDKPGSNENGQTPVEKDLYFYHPDHLGSSSYVTDTQGKLYEHLEYFPYGETWVEEATNTQRTPYLFTSKELDEETGLYYFGARYYDPRTSIWETVDPRLLDGFYTASLRGVQNMESDRAEGIPRSSIALNGYSYADGRPVMLIDPNGKEPNKGQVGAMNEIVHIVQSIEHRNPGLAPKDVLKATVALMRSRRDDPGATRYLYTEKSEWIDAKHFFAAAESAVERGEVVTNLLGFGVEVTQVGDPSFFSYEDLGSNAAGADFGDEFFKPEGVRLSVQVRNYLMKLNPKLPSEAPNYLQLPERELGGAGASSGRANQSTQGRTPSRAESRQRPLPEPGEID